MEWYLVLALLWVHQNPHIIFNVVAYVVTELIAANSKTAPQRRRSRCNSSRGRNPTSSSSSPSSISTDLASAYYAITFNNIPLAAHEACEDLNIYGALGFTADELRLDMQCLEASYLKNPYHNRHHGADVLSKSASTLKRDGRHLRRLVRRALGVDRWNPDCERRFMLFQLAVILAAAQHDSLHPGYNNAYLKATKHVMALTHTTAEQASVAFFQNTFLAQQRILSGLSEEERQLVQQIVTFAIAQTDMAVHAAVLQWQAHGALEVMKHLAAIIAHAADLGNAADDWSVSLLWARWCNAEFRAQGDHSRRYHPKLPLAAQFDRKVADVPNSQLWFIQNLAAPTFAALQLVAPCSAKKGLQGCMTNAGICNTIVLRNQHRLAQRVMNKLGWGKLPCFL